MDLNAAYFKRKEFACKCGCGFDTVDYPLIHVLTLLRIRFKRPVVILSGCRCEKHNREIGGAKHSQHLLGRAADFYIPGVDIETVYAHIKKLMEGEVYGLGKYKTFIHLDTRSGEKPAFWAGWHSTREGTEPKGK